MSQTITFSVIHIISRKKEATSSINTRNFCIKGSFVSPRANIITSSAPFFKRMSRQAISELPVVVTSCVGFYLSSILCLIVISNISSSFISLFIKENIYNSYRESMTLGINIYRN